MHRDIACLNFAVRHVHLPSETCLACASVGSAVDLPRRALAARRPLLVAPRGGPQLASASVVAAQGAAARVWQARAGWRRTVNVLLGREGRGFKCSVSWFAKARRRGASHASEEKGPGMQSALYFPGFPAATKEQRGSPVSLRSRGKASQKRSEVHSRAGVSFFCWTLPQNRRSGRLPEPLALFAVAASKPRAPSQPPRPPPATQRP